MEAKEAGCISFCCSISNPTIDEDLQQFIPSQYKKENGTVRFPNLLNETLNLIDASKLEADDMQHVGVGPVARSEVCLKLSFPIVLKARKPQGIHKFFLRRIRDEKF